LPCDDGEEELVLDGVAILIGEVVGIAKRSSSILGGVGGCVEEAGESESEVIEVAVQAMIAYSLAVDDEAVAVGEGEREPKAEAVENGADVSQLRAGILERVSE